MSDFRSCMEEEFGAGQGRALVQDHVVSALGHRTAQQALADGVAAREVWFALCEDLGVPADRRWGPDAQHRHRPSGPR